MGFADHLEGFTELLAARGVVLTLGGNNLDCIVERSGNDAQPYDLAPGDCQSVTISTLKSQFVTTPSVGSYLLDPDGGQYRIKAIRPNPGKPVAKFICEYFAGETYGEEASPDTAEGFAGLLEVRGVPLDLAGLPLTCLVEREGNEAQEFDLAPGECQSVIVSVLKSEIVRLPTIGSYFTVSGATDPDHDGLYTLVSGTGLSDDSGTLYTNALGWGFAGRVPPVFLIGFRQVDPFGANTGVSVVDDNNPKYPWDFDWSVLPAFTNAAFVSPHRVTAPPIGSYFTDADGAQYRITAHQPCPGSAVSRFVCEFSRPVAYVAAVNADEAEGFADLLEAFGIQLTYSNASITAILARVGNESQPFDLEPGDVQQVVVTAAKSEFEAVPDIGEYFTDDEGGIYRIVAINPVPGRLVAGFICEYSGAELDVGLCIDADGALSVDADFALATDGGA